MKKKGKTSTVSKTAPPVQNEADLFNPAKFPQLPEKIVSGLKRELVKTGFEEKWVNSLFTNQNQQVQNGLASALGFSDFAGAGFPFNQGVPGTAQLSNVNTIFANLRWYLISNFRQVLSEVYVELGLVQTIVDVPVDDALRGGVEIKSKKLDEDEIKELMISIDRDDDLNVAGQAAKWNRLFGGSGVLIMTDQDPKEPLDIAAIQNDSPLIFRPVDMWELYWDLQNTEGYDPTQQLDNFEYYSYYSEQVHKSRVMVMKGLTAPSFIRPRLRGWGYSEVEKLVRSLNQYLKNTDVSFEVLDEFKLDVYKFKNLTDTLLSPNGDQKVKQRVQLANWNKNYQNAIVLDSEDEFDHKQLSFAGLAEVMQGIRMQVASDMRMPLTKLFGISAAGFNSGEDDIEVYNAMVESTVRNKIKYVILRMIEIKCQKLFGYIPDDLEISFKPLRILSAKEEEDVKTQKFTRVLQAKQGGEITTLEFRDACNKDNLLPITLDTTADSLNPDDPNIAALVEGGNPEENGPDQNDPGSDRVDSETPQIKSGKTSKTQAPEPKAPKEPKVANTLKPFTPLQMLERSQALKFKNSPAFDRASYAADGGDEWIDPRKQYFYEKPNVDEGLWARAKQASQEAFGKEKWQFVLWWYKKQGGKFL